MKPLNKTYQPKEHEAAIYELWENSGAFKPSGEGEPFCIIMPPPNANGKLHWGHAIGYTTEDVITRYKRMQGYKTLWLPGTDHAGIETQFVYERDVLAPQGKSRFDLGPDKFYQAVMDYTQTAGGAMIDQFRSMGFSADWSKQKFTLDSDIISIVCDTFAKLHDDGYIYRGNRLVNWCSRCQAAFADIELERRQRTDTMYYLNYGALQIATVRPETIFADVAVAVNPKDKKYAKLVGKDATIPLIGRTIPIIADAHVDPSAGTGALKVTPGHDQADYEIGKRHNLPELSVIDQEGKLINVPEQFAGLSVEQGREVIAKELQKNKALVRTEKIKHAVAVHDRCGTVIEPLISEQWFLRVGELNKATIKAFESQIQVFPERFSKIAIDWLKQEHDWCISRQIWWGIRIPVYYKTSNDPDKKSYIVAKTEAEAEQYYGKGNYRAETDTFDTWFSSGQWPFATLQTVGEYKQFYPTSLMGTAREILHKWVTRMVMLGLYATKEVPFKQVYLWGLVTDEHGQKMSKSKGNVIDPLVITAKYGTDALRLAGAIANTPGNDSPMSEKQVEAMRNFCNKLWNVARFCLAQPDTTTDTELSLADQWWQHQLSLKAKEITSKIEQYRLNEAANSLYHLLWDDFADWYLEASKVSLNSSVLHQGLESILKLAHPFIPFITETIWQQLPGQHGNLISAAWPKPAASKQSTEHKLFSSLQQIVTQVRAVKAELGLSGQLLLLSSNKHLVEQKALFRHLAGVVDVEYAQKGSGIAVIAGSEQLWLAVDPDTQKRYHNSLKKQLQAAEAYSSKLSAQLQNKQFVSSAPKAVVQDTKTRLAEAKQHTQALRAQLDSL